jgi:hypothetical protein
MILQKIVQQVRGNNGACGMVINGDLSLTTDLNWLNDGLILGTDNIVINLNNYPINANLWLIADKVLYSGFMYDLVSLAQKVNNYYHIKRAIVSVIALVILCGSISSVATFTVTAVPLFINYGYAFGNMDGDGNMAKEPETTSAEEGKKENGNGESNVQSKACGEIENDTGNTESCSSSTSDSTSSSKKSQSDDDSGNSDSKTKTENRFEQFSNVTGGPDFTRGTYANGDTITHYHDGTDIRFFAKSGTTIILYNDGVIVTNKPDGTILTDLPTGHWFLQFPTKPDGSFKTYYENGTNTITDKDGTIIRTFTE